MTHRAALIQDNKIVNVVVVESGDKAPSGYTLMPTDEGNIGDDLVNGQIIRRVDSSKRPAVIIPKGDKLEILARIAGATKEELKALLLS